MQIGFGEALPADHLARFIVSIVALLDLSKVYGQYRERGGMPYAPEVLLGLLLYRYASGLFSTQKIEKGTYELIPMRYIAGGIHPAHDTINTFRKENLEALKGLFVEVLLMAHMMGYVKLGNISIDGSKAQADASKSQAMSYGRIGELEVRLQAEIEQLFALADVAEGALPDEFDGDGEITLRRQKLATLAEAKAVLAAPVQVREAEERTEYARKVAARQEREERTGKKSGGRPPKAPEPGPQDKEQYNFTDPESRIMKPGNGQGFAQAYNAQMAVAHESRLIVGNTLSNHPNDKQEGVPTAQAIPAALGVPKAAVMDNGYFSPATIQAFKAMGIDPCIAPGRERHHLTLAALLDKEPDPPPADADPLTQMVYKLRTAAGDALYRLRKSTVEPVFGIIKALLGFRLVSLRGLVAAAGEWNRVCLAYNLKRLHRLQTA